MTLRPPHERLYERVLVYGNEGTGKTRAWLDIAALSQRSGSDAMFYAIDSEVAAIPRMLSGETFRDLTNVHHEPVSDYPEMFQAIRALADKVRPNDWLILDRADAMWEMAQDHYVDLRYGRTMGEQWLSWVTTTGGDTRKGRLLEGDTDWGTINKLYRDLTTPVVRLQGHLFMTAPARKVGERDEQGIRDVYGRFGFRPEGQRHLGHLSHTTLLLNKTGQEEWRITSVKDRERKLLEGEVVQRFSTAYLIKVAGWRP